MAKSSKAGRPQKESAAPQKESINKSAANPQKSEQKGNPKDAAQPQAPPLGDVKEEATKGEAISTPMGSKVQQQGEEGD